MPTTIDLNCDMGESFGLQTIGADEGVIRSISSANLACGFHGGDPHVMRRSVALCKAHGVAVGAHPGLPDLLGFGRRRMQVTPGQVKDFLTYQIGAMRAFVSAAGMTMQHVKPHGALYMMGLEDDALSDAMVEAVAQLDDRLSIYTTADTATERAAARRGIAVLREFFADRAMADHGWRMFDTDLTALGSPEDIARRAVQAVTQGSVTTTEGKTKRLAVDTICVHSDTPGSPALLAALSQALQEAGVRVQSPSGPR